MKLTKRIFTMATCLAMAVSSMAGVTASAAHSTTLLAPRDPVSVTIGGVTYELKIMSSVDTSTSNGRKKATAETHLYDVNTTSLPTDKVVMQTMLYGKTSSGDVALIEIGYDIIEKPYYPSSVYTTASFTDYNNEWASFMATGWARMRPNSFANWTYVYSDETSYIS